MRKEIKKIEEKYNINFYIERERMDAYDIRSSYITRVWTKIKENIICITYTKISNVDEKIKDLEQQIIDILN